MKKVLKKVPGTEQAAPEKKEKGHGYNFYAIGFMILFALPVLLTSFIYISDFLFPDAAQNRLIRQKVMRCYQAANPSKVNEVDNILAKYKGKELRLFANLKEKYYKVSECNFGQ